MLFSGASARADACVRAGYRAENTPRISCENSGANSENALKISNENNGVNSARNKAESAYFKGEKEYENGGVNSDGIPRNSHENGGVNSASGNAGSAPRTTFAKGAGKAAESAAEFASKSVCLVDFNTGTELFERNADKRLPIASMVKIMTLLLSYEAAEKGAITLDTEIQVGENAAGMGGSQVFLDANSVHTAGNLLKAITVCSANDASVAMAEALAGSEELFVEKMNGRASELGMENTVFTNCTGLPKAGQYSTARDVSKMYRELLKHKDYFRYTKIWLEEYVHPDGRKTEMTNTNKLVRFYKGCDAGKTGFTSESLFCLSASAVGGNMRAVAVVMGADTSPKRFDDAKKLFNYAFANYENKKLVEKDCEIPNTIRVKGGKTDAVRIAPAESLFVLNKKGGGAKYTVEYELPSELKAGIRRGQTIGRIVAKKDGDIVGSCDAVALDGAEKAAFLDGLKKIISKW
jgi:D-alanyl-D-alanine carboxypeptidase (penicillin-binding protein 5/6)